ncbi:hypothetical protein P7C70_g549, partial [Phenoliferia sp. Uapishka_3]
MLHRHNSKRVPQRGPALAPTSDSSHPAEPPTDPAPQEGTRPTDVLVNRMHEVKRITKSLASYFEEIASTHATQSKNLLNISTGKTIESPLPEAELFLPTPVKEGGQIGFAEILTRVKENTRLEADGHSVLAREVSDGVVTPLKKLRVDIKAHISSLDKEVIKIADAVAKERATSVEVLTHLAKSIASHQITPLSLPSHEDPFVVRSHAESQMREQVTRENELLKAALLWQEKTKELEISVWTEVTRCWAVWEEAHAKMLLSTQTRSSELHETVTTVQPETEWNHFETLNYLIPPSTPARDLSLITFPGQEDPATLPIKQGVLERKKRFVRNWKEAYFVLTPSGYLHEYRSSSSPLATPYLSLHLPHATLGPMPSPGTSKGGRMKEPKFIIQGREAEKGGVIGSVRGSMKLQKSDLERVYRGKSWEAVSEWWVAIEKFTKSYAGTTAKVLADIQGPGPTAVQSAGMVPVGIVEGDELSDEEIEDGSSEEEFSDARTGPVLATVSEAKPGYTTTPGVVSGAERDVKLKNSAKQYEAGADKSTLKASLFARPSTSKRKVEDTSGASASASASSPPSANHTTHSPTNGSITTSTTSPSYHTNPTAPATSAARPTPVPIVIGDKRAAGGGKKRISGIFGWGKKI